MFNPHLDALVLRGVAAEVVNLATACELLEGALGRFTQCNALTEDAVVALQAVDQARQHSAALSAFLRSYLRDHGNSGADGPSLEAVQAALGAVPLADMSQRLSMACLNGANPLEVASRDSARAEATEFFE